MILKERRKQFKKYFALNKILSVVKFQIKKKSLVSLDGWRKLLMNKNYGRKI